MKRIRVLIVDDSAFARKVIREVLTRDPIIEVVGIARDGLEALEKLAELKPDVMTLDLVMPDLDGIGVLRSLPKDTQTRVIVVSVSGSETDLAIEALHAGAVDLVTKPTPLPTDRLYELSTELIEKVKAAAVAQRRMFSEASEASAVHTSALLPVTKKFETRLVVIGTSTGGPQALTQLFHALRADLDVAFAIALHIPSGFTAPLAARISKESGIQIEEAYDGLEVRPGHAVIAPGGMHLYLESIGEKIVCKISYEPAASLHHPSVDVLFSSAAKNFGNGVLGVILTGMGSDGLKGCEDIRSHGGRVLAESASSCVVYGMPRSVVEAGLANGQAPLEHMAQLLTEQI